MITSDINSHFKVTVFGTGSLGANTSLNISRRLGSDIGFYLIDFDNIDVDNLINQPWMDFNIGQKKITVLASVLWHTSKCKSVCYHKKIKNVSDIEILPYIKNSDLLIDCFDNPASRRLTQLFANKYYKYIIHSGFSEFNFKVAWGTEYIIKGNSFESREPICDKRDMAMVVQIGAALTAKVCYHFLINKIKKSYYFDFQKNGNINLYNLKETK